MLGEGCGSGRGRGVPLTQGIQQETIVDHVGTFQDGLLGGGLGSLHEFRMTQPATRSVTEGHRTARVSIPASLRRDDEDSQGMPLSWPRERC